VHPMVNVRCVTEANDISVMYSSEARTLTRIVKYLSDGQSIRALNASLLLLLNSHHIRAFRFGI
jgi:hypothetical protein